jgi:3-oxoacyl-ACP reductase-like protein
MKRSVGLVLAALAARWYSDREDDEVDTLATVAIGWTFGT